MLCPQSDFYTEKLHTNIHTCPTDRIYNTWIQKRAV